jgi:hypothetical protein
VVNQVRAAEDASESLGSLDSDSEEAEDDDDEDDVEEGEPLRTGILRVKDKVFYTLGNGHRVPLVDGSLSYPHGTILSENQFLFYIRKTVDSTRDVKVQPFILTPSYC